MHLEVKRRKAILYSLIASVLLIQLAVSVFFYNEYFNGRKLDLIKKQIEQGRNIDHLTKKAKKEFGIAQEYLQKFFISRDDRDLQLYFASLKRLSDNLDTFVDYGYKNPEFLRYVNADKSVVDGPTELKRLIDSTQQVYKTYDTGDVPIKFDSLKIKVTRTEPVIQIERKNVAAPDKKGLFGRLGDAIKGRQQTKIDTVVITNSQENSVDIAALQEDLKNVVKVANQQYRERIKEIRTKQIIKQNSNSVLYGLFGKLLASSNSLLEAYDMAVEAYRAKLDLQYREQVEKNNSIRSRTVLSLMVLMFIVSIIIIYYIKQSFDYERKLRTANELINKNLSFKNRIIGMIGHEMRAPMQIMNIFMDRIAKVINNGKASEYLKSMKFTNNSLLVQANQILEYAKNSDKKNEAECTVFNLPEHIDSILVAFEAFAESRDNHLVVRNEIPKDLTVCSDFAKIYQLFTNILSNANKFTEKGQISVYSSTTDVDHKKTKLHVSISDNGMGISEDELTEIFKPYHRGMVSDKVANIGAGLGLNLCKEIVELFDGEICASSAPGEGTTIEFEIYLDLP